MVEKLAYSAESAGQYCSENCSLLKYGIICPFEGRHTNQCPEIERTFELIRDRRITPQKKSYYELLSAVSHMQKAHPVFVDNDMGIGTLIGDAFITAGHLFDKSRVATTYIAGKKIILNASEALILSTIPDSGYAPDTVDLAIFILDGVIEDNNKICSLDPKVGDVLSCYSLRTKANPSIVFCSSPDIFSRFTTCCEVTAKEGNFYEAICDDIMKPGDSGAPLFRGDELVGILSGGEEGTTRCVFHPVSVISRILKDRLVRNL